MIKKCLNMKFFIDSILFTLFMNMLYLHKATIELMYKYIYVYKHTCSHSGVYVKQLSAHIFIFYYFFRFLHFQLLILQFYQKKIAFQNFISCLPPPPPRANILFTTFSSEVSFQILKHNFCLQWWICHQKGKNLFSIR